MRYPLSMACSTAAPWCRAQMLLLALSLPGPPLLLLLLAVYMLLLLLLIAQYLHIWQPKLQLLLLLALRLAQLLVQIPPLAQSGIGGHQGLPRAGPS